MKECLPAWHEAYVVSEVVTLIEAGMTAYAIAEVTGIAVDVIENMMED